MVYVVTRSEKEFLIPLLLVVELNCGSQKDGTCKNSLADLDLLQKCKDARDIQFAIMIL